MARRYKTVKKYLTDAPEGLYRAIRTTYTYVGGNLMKVKEGDVVSLLKGEATEHFESLSGHTGSVDVVSIKILNALNQLDPRDDKHWTEAGLPRMDVIETLISENVTRKQVDEALPGFSRDVMSLKQVKEEDGIPKV